mgnify:CR=1 FL=1
MKLAYFTWVLVIITCTACSPIQNPTPYKPIELSLTHGKMVYYGAFYDSVPNNVIALDIYSEGITFDSAGYMQGDGSNLYLSDIFIPISDTTLASSTYHCDSSTTAFSFLPGMDFESNPTGTYLLQLVDSRVRQILLFTEGHFTYTRQGDTADIVFTLTANKHIYTISFHGPLTYERHEPHL